MAEQQGQAEGGQRVGEFTGRMRATGRYPHLTELMSAGYDPDAAETRDARFEFGLDCLLDGVAARIAGGKAGGPPASAGLAGGPPG
ncbi:MAG: TetR/AcrR family transcriptional regulator C-terminal domain-containing protein [Streptosporangiaceae bacterium]